MTTRGASGWEWTNRSDPLNLLVNAGVGMWQSKTYCIQSSAWKLSYSFPALLFYWERSPVPLCSSKVRVTMNQSKQLVRLIEIAVMTGIAIVLDIASGMFLKMPQGGSIAIMMIPIFLISFRWGLKAGLITGFLAGLLQFVTGGFMRFTPYSFSLIILSHQQLQESAVYLPVRSEKLPRRKQRESWYHMLRLPSFSEVDWNFSPTSLAAPSFLEITHPKGRRSGFIH